MFLHEVALSYILILYWILTIVVLHVIDYKTVYTPKIF